MRIAALVAPSLALSLVLLAACSGTDPAEPLLGTNDQLVVELRGDFGEFYLGDALRYGADGTAARMMTTNHPLAHPALERALGRLPFHDREILNDLFRQTGALPARVAAPEGSGFPRSDFVVQWNRNGHATQMVIEDVFAQPELPIAVARAVGLFETLPGD